jgi:hypothetical protein
MLSLPTVRLLLASGEISRHASLDEAWATANCVVHRLPLEQLRGDWPTPESGQALRTCRH